MEGKKVECEMIQYIVTIIMGTVIGYGTNYLAVKMLFRPKHEVKLWGKTLPFTPGVIPKQKSKLAGAVGNAVGTSLLTKDDIKSKLAGEELKKAVTEKITEVLSTQLKDEIMTLSKLDEESYGEMKGKLSVMLTKQIMDSVNAASVGDKISQETAAVLMEKVQGNMLKYVVTEEMVKAFTDHVGRKVQEYIEENGALIVRKQVDKKIDETEANSITELLEKVNITSEKLEEKISEYYDKAVESAVDQLMSKIDIAEMIKTKIDEMDVDMLEELTLKVMKDQLDVIINLGALIGFALALINVGINAFFG